MKRLLVTALLGASLFAFNTVNGVSNNSNTSANYYNSYQIEGKVLKAYTQPGFGRRGVEWLFMDVQTKNDIVTVFDNAAKCIGPVEVDTKILD